LSIEVVTVLAANDHITGVSDLSRESLQEARLTGAVGADESNNLTLSDFEADVVQRKGRFV